MADLSNEFTNLPENSPKEMVQRAAFSQAGMARNYLISRYEFRYNEITTELEYRMRIGDQKLEDNVGWIYFDDNAYRLIDNDLLINAGMNVTEKVFKSVIWGGLATFYNPYREYFRKLPEWDGTDYFEEFLKGVELEDEALCVFFVGCFRKWFVAFVASLISDRIINHTCFVMIGNQGVAKSTFFNNLLPKQLYFDYYHCGPFYPEKNKDHEFYLATMMLINLEEFATMNKTDMETLKSLITQPKVNGRKAWGKGTIKLWRRASFCATINQDEPLTDMSGNRRFLVFKIKAIDYMKDYNVDKLYTQALALYGKGFQYWFDTAEIASINAYNENFRMRTLEEETIQHHFRVPNDYDRTQIGWVRFVTTSDIVWELAKEKNKLNVNNSSIKNFGAALKKLGFKTVSKRVNGQPVKGYWVVNINATTTPQEQSDDDPF